MPGRAQNEGVSRGVGYKLSPNEEAAVLKEEQDRRRKLRLKQVREQDRLFAKRMLAKAKAKKELEVKALSAKLEEEWQAVQQEKQEALRDIYDKCLERVGDGHRAAQNQKPVEEEKAAASRKNAKAAKQRHQEAIARELTQRDEQWQKENAHIVARKNALQVEKVRASYVANLPPPQRDPLADLDLQKPPVQVIRNEGFAATTHYHIPADYVEKAEPAEQEDAREAARVEEERLKTKMSRIQGEDAREAARAEEERLKTEMTRIQGELRERQEKATLRHKHAREKELLKQDYERLLLELSDLQNADRRRRQAVVADIPRQVFQPPHRRLEERTEKQHEMEEAFEDMYMKHTDYAGDITLALEPRVPAHDTELDLTADTPGDQHHGGGAGGQEGEEVTLERPPAAGFTSVGPGPDHHRTGTTGAAGPLASLVGGSKPDQKPASTRADMLKKLMGRIRGQQDDWRKQQVQVSATIVPGSGHTQRTTLPEDETTSSSQPLSVDQPMDYSTDSPMDTPLYRHAPPQGSSGSPPTDLTEHTIESGVSEGSSTMTGAQSLETGSLSEESLPVGTTLLHPMERAAMIRSKQISQQKRTQQDIKAIGEEQRNRLADLKQAFFVPWDEISQAREPIALQDQEEELTQQAGEERLDNISEAPRHVGAQSQRIQDVDPSLGFPGQMDSHQIREPLADGRQEMQQRQSHQPPGDYASEPAGDRPHMLDHVGHTREPVPVARPDVPDQRPYPVQAHDRDSMRQQPTGTIADFYDSQQDGESGDQSDIQSSRPSLSSSAQDSQEGSSESSRIDWLQRARAYQQSLLDRQRQGQDSLLQAQIQLQERRERLLRNYPDVNLPTYVPYPLPTQDRQSHPSTGFPTAPIHSDAQILEATGRIQLPSPQHPQPDETSGQSAYRTMGVDQGEDHDTKYQSSDTLSTENSKISGSSPNRDTRSVRVEAAHWDIPEKSTVKTAFSPSKRRLMFQNFGNTEESSDAGEESFAPLPEEALSGTMTSGDDSAELHRQEQSAHTPTGFYHQSQHHAMDGEGSNASSSLEYAGSAARKEDQSVKGAEQILEDRHSRLSLENKILEERQQAQRARLLQKQHQLAVEIERQQKRYQERIMAAQPANVAPSGNKPRAPPLEHSPSIPQGVLQTSEFSSESPQMLSNVGTPLFHGSHSGRGQPEQMDARQLMQGQVFRPQDLLPHLQGSQRLGSSSGNETDESFQSSPAAGTLPSQGMMGVMRPGELLPHLLAGTHRSEDYSLQGSDQLSHSDEFLRHNFGDNYEASEGRAHGTSTDHLQFDGQYNDISSGPLDLDGIPSGSMEQTGSFNGMLRDQVFRPSDLLSQLRDIHQDVKTSDAFNSSDRFLPMATENTGSKIYTDSMEMSDRQDKSRTSERLELSHGQSASREYSSGASYHSSQGIDSNGRGPGRLYRDMLQGHVFRPGDLLPHLQGLPAQNSEDFGDSTGLESTGGNFYPTYDYMEPGSQRLEADGEGNEQIQQNMGRLSLTDDDLIQAGSPDLTRSPGSSVEPSMPINSTLISGPQVARTRRPPPANLHQMAMLQEDRAPHELSTIIEVETSLDERSHAQDMVSTSGNVTTASQGSTASSGRKMPSGTTNAPFNEQSKDPSSIGDVRSRTAHMEHSGSSSIGSNILISRPALASLLEEEENYSADDEGGVSVTTHQPDVSAVASSLSEYTLEEDGANSMSEHAMSVPGFHGAHSNGIPYGIEREEPAGQGIRWMDLLKASDATLPSSFQENFGSETSSGQVQPGIDGERGQGIPVGKTQSSERFTPESSFHQLPQVPMTPDVHGDVGRSQGVPVGGTSSSERFTPESSFHQLPEVPVTPHIHGESSGGDSRMAYLQGESVQLRTVHIRKHLAAGLQLSSSSSADSQNAMPAPPTLSDHASSSMTSSSKHSTVIGAVGGLSSQPITDEESESPLFVPKASQPRAFPSQPGTERSLGSQDRDGGHGGYDISEAAASRLSSGRLSEASSEMSSDISAPGLSQIEMGFPPLPPHQPSVPASGATRMDLLQDADPVLVTSQEEYIRNMLISLQQGRQRVVTLPLFSDVSLSGFSVSQDGSMSDIRSPLKPAGQPLPQRSPHPTLSDDQTFPSLSDIQMETGILEEPDMTFHTTLDTTADSLPPSMLSQLPERRTSPHVSREVSQAQELTELPLDTSQASDASLAQSLLSFQLHERELLLGASPSSQLSASPGQHAASSTDEAPSTGPSGSDESARMEEELRRTRSEGHVTEKVTTLTGTVTHGTVSLQEAFMQKKQAFMKASVTRKKEAKVRAESRSQESTVFAKTIQDWKRSKVKTHKLNTTSKKAPARKSDGAMAASGSGLSSSMKMSTDRNAVQRDMRDRNLRLYNRLEEVQKQKGEKERKEAYAANRQKKREFEQKLQAKRAKKAATEKTDKRK